MANSFYLKVISANRIFFSGKCESVVVPEFDGEKEILAHHENMVIAINRGDMRFKPEGESEWQEAVVGMVLVETAEHPEEIDMARAKEAKERAEEQMRQKQSIREYYHSRASLARAMARIKAASAKK